LLHLFPAKAIRDTTNYHQQENNNHNDDYDKQHAVFFSNWGCSSLNFYFIGFNTYAGRILCLNLNDVGCCWLQTLQNYVCIVEILLLNDRGAFFIVTHDVLGYLGAAI